MNGSTFGTAFSISTYGESHGESVGVIIEGCPQGTRLSLEFIQQELDRRRPGRSELTSSREEPDELVVVSGIIEGETDGNPIELKVLNVDKRSKDYDEISRKPRPGHADMTYLQKYGEIPLGGGRASGRETVSRVMAGAIAKQILLEDEIAIEGRIVEVGGHKGRFDEVILAAKANADSVGGVVEVVATGVPPGLGEPVFDKLDADLAKAMMSIPAVKGVEMGAGFAAAAMKGSQHNDPITSRGDGELTTTTNNAGGTLGGISNGMPIVCRIAVKPPSSIAREQDTIDSTTLKSAKLSIQGRHDPCICPRVVPVAESMMAIVLLDHLLRSRTGE